MRFSLLFYSGFVLNNCMSKERLLSLNFERLFIYCMLALFIRIESTEPMKHGAWLISFVSIQNLLVMYYTPACGHGLPAVL